MKKCRRCDKKKCECSECPVCGNIESQELQRWHIERALVDVFENGFKSKNANRFPVVYNFLKAIEDTYGCDFEEFNKTIYCGYCSYELLADFLFGRIGIEIIANNIVADPTPY